MKTLHPAVTVLVGLLTAISLAVSLHTSQQAGPQGVPGTPGIQGPQGSPGTAAISCSNPITGVLTPQSEGNRMKVTMGIGSEYVDGIIDTGGFQTVLPEQMMLDAGFTPTGTMRMGGIIPGASEVVDTFTVPVSSITVNGHTLSQSSSVITVMASPRASNDVLLSPDALRFAGGLSLVGNSWKLC